MVKSIVDAAVLEEAQLVDESAEAGDRVSPSSAKNVSDYYQFLVVQMKTFFINKNQIYPFYTSPSWY